MAKMWDWPWEPAPDYTRLLRSLCRQGDAHHVPFLELGADQEIIGAVLGEPPLRRQAADSNHETLGKALDQGIRFWHLLGYDAVLARPIVNTPPTQAAQQRLAADDTAELSHGRRHWAEEHRGAIASWEDFERYPWPKPGEADFFALEYLARHLPEGMGIIASPFGALQPVMLLMGYETFALALYEQRDLLHAIFDKIAELRVAMARALVQLDRVIALWLLDDLGFKTSTMISVKDLRELIFPIHKRIAEVAHQAGKPLLLHACGNLELVMEDLIEDVRIDARHSFEDAIQPVESVAARYGERIAIVGGMDMDLLARGSEEQVRARTRHVLQACAPRGSYILGTGNTVANYIPVRNYLAMLDEGWRFNTGR